MRYCVSGRQPYSVIKRADEIKFQYADRDRILDLVDRFPDKVIILDVPGDEENWKLWKMYQEKFFEFHVALHDLNRVKEFNEENINWYWPYPVTSYYELDMIVNLHPSYIMIGPPLSFDLDQVSMHLYDPCDETKQIPLRMVANVAHPDYLPSNCMLGVCGQWVRPEDTGIYSTRVQCLEFGNADLGREETLLHIYKENQEWPGNLNMLIQRLDFNVDNRAIPEELGERRMNCGHRCWRTGSCQLCMRAFQFAEQIRKESQNREKEL